MAPIKVKLNSLSNIDQDALQGIQEKNIFFAHQSVGYNIINGLKINNDENRGLSLNIIDSRKINEIGKHFFAHNPIGKNFDAKSKVDDFVKVIRENNENIDIAIFKFCYVDIETHTNIHDLFDYYSKEVNRLIEKYPKIRFIHVTVPLFTKAVGTKGLIKGLIGRDHNLKRNSYNNLLKKKYPAKNIFDLAMFESTWPDGTREINLKVGENNFALVPEYTEDGGHLNEKGGKFIGEQLLIFLAGIRDK